METIFDFEDNTLGYVGIHNVEKSLKKDGCKPQFNELMKLNDELAKSEKVTELKLKKLWLLKNYNIPLNTINDNKLKNNHELKSVIESQENWVNENKDLLKAWGVM